MEQLLSYGRQRNGQGRYGLELHAYIHLMQSTTTSEANAQHSGTMMELFSASRNDDLPATRCLCATTPTLVCLC